MLHDIGKTKLPEHLRGHHDLNPPEDADERAVWESHAHAGYEMVHNGVEASAAAAILQHHQRFDGNGFPALRRGKEKPKTLAGHDIHIFSRILAPTNLFDRVAQREGGGRKPNVVVLHELRTQFAEWLDPQVLGAMAAVIPPFPPGTRVELSDGTTAVVVDLDHHRPYQPTVRRVSGRTFTPQGAAIRLHGESGISVAKVGGVDVSAMYPPRRVASLAAVPA